MKTENQDSLPDSEMPRYFLGTYFLFFSFAFQYASWKAFIMASISSSANSPPAYRPDTSLECIFVNDVRPKRRKNNQVQRIVKRPAGVEREGRSEAEERPNEARRAARRGEIIAR